MFNPDLMVMRDERTRPRSSPSESSARAAAPAEAAAGQAVYRRNDGGGVRAPSARPAHVLLGCARRRARTGEGAEDAVQQALTIALAIRERIRPRTAVAYIAVIAQHEASRLRRLSDGLVSLDQPVASGQAIGHDALPDDRHADRDAVIDALSALRRDKPDHARALIARALGWRYREICDAFEWTYTKTNRCVTEGGAELRRRDGTQA